MDLLYFILSVYGICGLLVTINYRYVTKLTRDSNGRFAKKYFKGFKVFECPFCLGFWVGLILFMLNSFTNLFTFEVNFLNTILVPFISAGTTYVLGTVIDDGGIRIDNNCKNCKNGDKGYN